MSFGAFRVSVAKETSPKPPQITFGAQRPPEAIFVTFTPQNDQSEQKYQKSKKSYDFWAFRVSVAKETSPKPPQISFGPQRPPRGLQEAIFVTFTPQNDQSGQKYFKSKKSHIFWRFSISVDKTPPLKNIDLGRRKPSQRCGSCERNGT